MDAMTAQGVTLVDVLTETGAAEATAQAMAETISGYGYAPLPIAGVKQAIHAGAHLGMDAAPSLGIYMAADSLILKDT